MSEHITSLADNEVFVFGSNLAGRHGKGAALLAVKFGAERGKGFGRMGRSYAIPTKSRDLGVLPLALIKLGVNDFIAHARSRPHEKFLVTRIGCGLAGYRDSQIAPFFRDCLAMPNVVLPVEFKLRLGGPVVPPGYTADELDRDNPYCQ